MKLITEFIKKFTEKDIGRIIKIKERYYLVSEELEQKANKLSEKINKIPGTAGLFLGSEKEGKFKPSLGIIYKLSKVSKRKTIINKKQEWLFTNKKDLMTRGKTNIQQGLILVQNQFDENLGLGMIQGKGIKNLADIGDFMRRELDK